MSQLLTRTLAPPGTPLAALGGLPPIRGQIHAAAAKSTGDTTLDLSRVDNLSPSLAAILRPQAAYRWLLPYLASITPQYVEGILRGALAGNHVQAWELFDLMIDTDPEIAACVQEYTDGICGKKVHFEPYCEEGEEPTPSALERCKLVSAAYRNMRPDAAADENGFDGTIKDIIAGRFHGQSILEIDWLNTWGDQSLFVKNISGLGNVAVPRATYWVHPVCYAYDMNGRLGLRMSLTDSNGTSIQTATKLAKDTKMGKANPNPGQLNYVDPPAWNFVSAQPRPSMLMEFPRNKFLISIMKAKTGTALGGSCLRPLAWWWVASNFCGDWLLNYAQLFGIPFRKATYKANTSETVKAEIRQMLQSAGSAGYILLPDSAEMEFMKDGGGAGQSPQAFLFTFADSQKRKVILHQTQTGGHSGGGQGGFAGKFGEVEAQTKDACMGAGCRHVENVINQQFTPFVLEMNYGQGNDLEAPTCKLVDNKVGGLVDAQRDQVLVQIMDVGEDWMRRKYGVPKPGPGEKLCGQEVGSQVGQKQMDQDLQLKQSKISADATVQSAKHNADATKAAAALAPKGSNSSTETDNSDLEDEADAKAAKGAADAARAGMQDALEAGDATASRGCLMAMVPTDISAKFAAFSKGVVDPQTLSEDGVEDEPHVTVLYGFKPDFDAKQLQDFCQPFLPIHFKVGKLSRFECPKYDVIKFDIESPELESLNAKIAKKFKDQIVPSEHDYHPHLTVAYVQKGTNKNLKDSYLTGTKLAVNSLIYSMPEKSGRVSIKAGSAVEIFHSLQAADATPALAETIQPLLARLKAIDGITDPDSRRLALQKFLKDFPSITAAMKHDDSVAKAVTPDAVAAFVTGLKSKPMRAQDGRRSEALEAGDVAGHEFRGNQWTDSSGKSIADLASEREARKSEMVALLRSNPNSEETKSAQRAFDKASTAHKDGLAAAQRQEEAAQKLSKSQAKTDRAAKAFANKAPEAPRISIKGDTFPVKEKLKAIGAKWNPDQKAWTVTDGDMHEKAKAIMVEHEKTNTSFGKTDRKPWEEPSLDTGLTRISRMDRGSNSHFKVGDVIMVNKPEGGVYPHRVEKANVRFANQTLDEDSNEHWAHVRPLPESEAAPHIQKFQEAAASKMQREKEHKDLIRKMSEASGNF